ncbi:MAG: hypothetical protein AAF331_08905 [Pseudomonadota bacterium]
MHKTDSDILTLRQDPSEGMLRIGFSIMPLVVLSWFLWRAIGKQAEALELVFYVSWIIIAVFIVGLQVRRVVTKMIWARLTSEGVSNGEGEFLPWEDISEIRHVLGQIWIGKVGETLPFVSLTPRVIGRTQLEDAGAFLKRHAPAEKIRNL